MAHDQQPKQPIQREMYHDRDRERGRYAGQPDAGRHRAASGASRNGAIRTGCAI